MRHDEIWLRLSLRSGDATQRRRNDLRLVGEHQRCSEQDPLEDVGHLAIEAHQLRQHGRRNRHLRFGKHQLDGQAVTALHS